MATQRLNLVAPSGNRLEVDLPAQRPVSSIATMVRFVGGSYGTGFQIGPRGYHDFACTYVAPASQRERILVHGREVIISEAHNKESSVATLIGVYHELMTVYAGPAPRSDQVFALFSSLHIEDRVEGMVIKPVSASLLDAAVETVVVVVRDWGTLSIPGPRQALSLLPKHAGARTKHGEVWRATQTESGSAETNPTQGFLLGCPSGLAEVHLAGNGVTPQGELLGWLNEINVAWRAA
jgi:hypothetical protein